MTLKEVRNMASSVLRDSDRLDTTGELNSRMTDIVIRLDALMLEAKNVMWIKLEPEHVQEVFEILCEIPFEQATMFDSEPPTTRHDGIEQIIDQLQLRIDDEKIAEIEDMEA